MPRLIFWGEQYRFRRILQETGLSRVSPSGNFAPRILPRVSLDLASVVLETLTPSLDIASVDFRAPQIP